MEAYTHHRSRSRAAVGAQRPPPPASFSSKKPYANGNGFIAYDDAFGGPPKFGAAPPFAPRAEDYMEIFGSFLSSRASSIPILDLPPVDDSVSAFDFAGSGCDYTDVFGGLEFADFAVPYDELFRRSDGVDDSSDEAWISTASEESDPSGNSERNQCFLNSNFHQPAESQQFNVSYHQVDTGMEDSSYTRVAQVSAVPGYTYVVRGSTSLEYEDEESRCFGLMDGIILKEDLSGNISFETLDRSFSDPSHDFSGQQFYEPDLSTGRTDCASNYFLDPIVEQVTDIDIGSKISELGKQSKPPPNLVRRLETRGNCSNLRNCAYEKKAESGSLPLSDVDVDVSPSALASVEAMEEAMQRAVLKLKSAKESMERKKDGLNGAKPSMKNEISDGVKASIPCDESAAKCDVLQSKSHLDYKEIKNQPRTTSDSFETVLPSHDFLQAGQAPSATAKPSQKNVTKDHSPSSMDSGSVGEEDDEWKEASQYFELVNNVNIQKEPHLVDNPNRVELELNGLHVVNDIGRHMAVEQQHGDDRVVGSTGSSREAEGVEDLDLFEEDLEPRETRPRLRTIRAASRQDFHQKMVKVAQEFHERVMPNHVDSENKVKKGWKGDGSDGKTETCFQVNEQTNGGTAQDLGPCRNHEEAPSKVRTTNNSKEAKLAECGEGKEVFKGVQEESGMKKACARGENGASVKVPPPEKEKTRIVMKAHQSEVKKDYCAPKEKRRKEKACQGDENCSGDSIIFELKEDIAKNGRGLLRQRSKSLEEADSTLMEMDKEVSAGAFMKQPNENLRMEQLEESNKEDTVASCCYETEKDFIEQEELKKHERPLVYDFTAESKVSGVALKSSNNLESHIFEVESISCGDYVEFGLNSDVKECEKVSDNAGKHLDQHEGCRSPVLNDLQSDVEKSNNLPRAKMHVEAQQSASANESSRTNGENVEFLQVTHGPEERRSLNSSSPDVNGKGNSEMASRCEEETSSNASQKTCENEDITQPLVDEDELKAAERVDCSVSMENVHPQKVAKLVMPERKESIQNWSKPTTATRRLGLEGSVSNGSLTGEESGRRAERLNRARELEEERLRKVEEEREREREREKDRMGVELGLGERAFAEASGRVDKTAMDKATAEARQRAMAEARERLEKACAEARGKSISDKSSAAEAARLKAERAAVERATAEARERAVEKAKVERERLGRSVSDNITTRYSSLSSEFDGVEGETAERCKARLERHRRTVERVAKALAEKNMRDLIAQREQAERNRFAETLDADIKRWSGGKEGNLRALLSTLQYILGPDSGWQPIPLTEVITSAAVKKVYRKATLCVHPDKLQQRGATIQQKYVCEKVFDLLKDGWNKFNSEER